MQVIQEGGGASSEVSLHHYHSHSLKLVNNVSEHPTIKIYFPVVISKVTYDEQFTRSHHCTVVSGVWGDGEGSWILQNNAIDISHHRAEVNNSFLLEFKEQCPPVLLLRSEDPY